MLPTTFHDGVHVTSGTPYTATSTSKVYVGLHKEQLSCVLSDGAVNPWNVMKVADRRAWVPLATTAEAALDRASWGVEELGYEQDKSQLLLFTFEFTAAGFGHFMLANVLTTRDWKHFRFYGSLPLRCTSIQGDLLVYAHDTVSSLG